MVIFDIPDPQKIHAYLKNINKAIGEDNKAPPGKGVVLLGYDANNNVMRYVRTTSDGKLVLWLL